MLAKSLLLVNFVVCMCGASKLTLEIAPSQEWVRIGSIVHNVKAPGEFYYARGSRQALTNELEAHRVGGQGRWHLFQFPAGAPASVPEPLSKTRRSSVSALVQLSAGSVLNLSFPLYAASKTYQNPLSADEQKIEEKAANEITNSSILADLQEVTGFGTRSFSNAEASADVEQYLLDKFKAFGLTTCLQKFEAGRYKLANVVAYKQGQGKGAVTVGAHYDSRPFEGAAPGADDNGSGLVALLSIAKAYMSSGVSSTKSVYFVGFAGEEDGLDGSKAFADDLFGRGIPTECVAGSSASSFLQSSRHTESKDLHRAIILDEVGWRTKNAKYPKPTLNMESYDWADEVLDHVASASAALNGDSLVIEHSNNPFGSDHMSFLENGVPAALMINADDEAYPDYHKSTDTIDNVDTSYVAQIAKASLGGLIRLAH